jgi:hypothetical protein
MTAAGTFRHFDMAPLANHKHPLGEAILGKHQRISHAKL